MNSARLRKTGLRHWLIGFGLVLAVGCSGRAEDVPIPPPAFPSPTAPPPPPGASDIVSEHFPSPLSIADAERILLKTEIFHYSDPGPAVRAYNVVLDQPDARARFESIGAKARWAGQLYALCALFVLNPSGVPLVQQRLSSIQDEILVYQSDVSSRRSVADVVRLIRDDKLWVAFRRLKEIPVRVVLSGAPFDASVASRRVLSDGPIDLYIPALYNVQRAYGTFAGDTLVVAFEGGTADGGVKRGSLVITKGPGALPEKFEQWHGGCVAVWRGEPGQVKAFGVRFNVTTDPKLACPASVSK
jgi:hypothetical protein